MKKRRIHIQCARCGWDGWRRSLTAGAKGCPRCGGPVTTYGLRPACGHRRVFRTINNRIACEDCARRSAGWKQCKAPRCEEFVEPPAPHLPRDGKAWRQFKAAPLCEAHVNSYSTQDCHCGNGKVDCGEADCHGEYCDYGVAECRDCDGSGYVIRRVERVL